jgi:heme/copper-type cytochrome/quinol oxidase subunit 3
MPENEFLPLILLFLFGGFAVLSAVLKARARLMALPAVALAVLEAISGMALMAAAVPTSGSLESASRIGILTAVLVVVSSTVHMAKVRARSRVREESEGKRLYAALKYGIDGSPSTLADELPEGTGPSGVDGPQ